MQSNFLDGRIYVGMTNDIKRRFKEHSRGKTKSTKNRDSFRLIYNEDCLNREDARKSEKYWKSGIGKERLRHLGV